MRKVIAALAMLLTSSIAVIAIQAPAIATVSDDLAWFGTSTSQPTSNALQILTSGTSAPMAAVTQPPALGTVLATDSTFLYFIQNGNLVKSERDGSAVTTVLSNLGSLSTPLSNIYGLTAAGSNVYAMDSVAGVWRLPISGTAPTKVNNGGLSLAGWQTTNAQPLAATSTILYWGESDGLHSWTLNGTPGTENALIPNSVFSGQSGAPAGIAPLSIAANGEDLAMFCQTGSGISSLFQFTSGTWSYIGYPSYSVMYAVGIAYSPTTIYFSDFGGSVLSYPASGTRTDNTAVSVFSHNYDSEAVVYLPPVPSKTVTFNSNSGTGTMTNQSSSTAANLTANSFTRSGYSFNGWNTAANGTGNAYANQASFPFTADTTLYAQWTADSSGGGSSGGDTLPNTGAHVGPTLGISSALLSIGLAITAFAMYRRRKV